jgi:hypothetical protein
MVTEVCLCDLQYELETVTGEGRIQGNITAPCFKNAQETHEGIHRALDTETHGKIRSDS